MGGFVVIDQFFIFLSFFVDIIEVDEDFDKWFFVVQVQFFEVFKLCFIFCSKVGEGFWFLFLEVDQLVLCKEIMLFNVVVQMVEVKDMFIVIRVCIVDYDIFLFMRVVFVLDLIKVLFCIIVNKVLEDVFIFIYWFGKDGEFLLIYLLLVGCQVKSYFVFQKLLCFNNVMVFGYLQMLVIGVFVGVEVYQYGVILDVFQ